MMNNNNNNMLFSGDHNYSYDHGFEFCHEEGIHDDDVVCFSSRHEEAEVVVEGESSSSSSSTNEVVEGDYFDGVFKYIQEMLMEEDNMGSRPCMFQDCIALQAAEKSFYDALNPPSSSRATNGLIDDGCNGVSKFVGPQSFLEQDCNASSGMPLNSLDANGLYDGGGAVVPAHNIQGGSSSSRRSEGKKNVHNLEDGDSSSKQRNPKQFATSYGGESEHTEENYDKALLCPGMSPSFCLLTRCAEAAASYNSKTFVEVLKKIRQHSSPFGDATARLAHCFANALEARFEVLLIYTISKMMLQLIPILFLKWPI